MNEIPVGHSNKQGAELGFWNIVVPSDANTKKGIMQELYSIPYSAHPGIQKTLSKVKGSLYWKWMTGDIRRLGERCPMCQVEKSDHTLSKAKLRSTHIPETKWSEISIDLRPTYLNALGIVIAFK